MTIPFLMLVAAGLMVALFVYLRRQTRRDDTTDRSGYQGEDTPRNPTDYLRRQ